MVVSPVRPLQKDECTATKRHSSSTQPLKASELYESGSSLIRQQDKSFGKHSDFHKANNEKKTENPCDGLDLHPLGNFFLHARC